jgi:prevent-host-death family protein
MEKMLSIAEARRALNRLPEHFEQTPDTSVVAVTRRGKPVLAVLPWAQYEALVETLEVLADEKQTSALRQAIAECDAGGGIAWSASEDRAL